MAPRVIMVLGRSVWTRDESSWRREAPEDRGGPAPRAATRLAEIVSEARSARTVVVYEPGSMSHQPVETPNVSRHVFASLARVRSEHPVVVSEGLGWGMERPEPAPGGTFSTLLHYELTPGLAHLRDAASASGSRLEAAWSAYTVACACAGARALDLRLRIIVFLIPGFVAAASFAGGRRSFKAWIDPLSEHDWKVLLGAFGDVGSRPVTAASETESRGGWVGIIAHGPPEAVCPVWGAVLGSGRIEFVADLDALAAAACRIPRSHPGNLVGAFPTPRRLDNCLVGMGAACLASSLVLAHGVLSTRNRIGEEAAAARGRAAALEARLSELTGNRAEMRALRAELTEEPGYRVPKAHQVLLSLSSDIPEALTLTSLVLGKDDSFGFEAVLTGPGFDPEETRRTLSRDGFETDPQGGWSFDASSGKLSVRGKVGRRGE